MKAIRSLFNARFKAQRAAVLDKLQAEATKLAKMTEQEFLDLWDSLAADGRDELRQALTGELATMGRDGARQGMIQVLNVVPAGDKDIDAMLAQANDAAVTFAQDRAAELVGMKYDPDAGEWVTNPNPEWSIDETTRDNIQSLTTQAMEEGWSNDELADRIQEDEGFSDYRAEMVARTETAFADVNGNMESYKASGVVDEVEWIVGDGECDICQENADAGPVPIGEAFPSGDDMPPAHPNCRCDLLPVVNQPEEELDAAAPA